MNISSSFATSASHSIAFHVDGRSCCTQVPGMPHSHTDRYRVPKADRPWDWSMQGLSCWPSVFEPYFRQASCRHMTEIQVTDWGHVCPPQMIAPMRPRSSSRIRKHSRWSDSTQGQQLDPRLIRPRTSGQSRKYHCCVAYKNMKSREILTTFAYSSTKRFNSLTLWGSLPVDPQQHITSPRMQGPTPEPLFIAEIAWVASLRFLSPM